MKFDPKLTTVEVEAAFGGQFTAVQAIPEGNGGQGVVFRAIGSGPVKGSTSVVALKIYYPGSMSERTVQL